MIAQKTQEKNTKELSRHCWTNFGRKVQPPNKVRKGLKLRLHENNNQLY